MVPNAVLVTLVLGDAVQRVVDLGTQLHPQPAAEIDVLQKPEIEQGVPRPTDLAEAARLRPHVVD